MAERVNEKVSSEAPLVCSLLRCIEKATFPRNRHRCLMEVSSCMTLDGVGQVAGGESRWWCIGGKCRERKRKRKMEISIQVKH